MFGPSVAMSVTSYRLPSDSLVIISSPILGPLRGRASRWWTIWEMGWVSLPTDPGDGPSETQLLPEVLLPYAMRLVPYHVLATRLSLISSSLTPYLHPTFTSQEVSKGWDKVKVRGEIRTSPWLASHLPWTFITASHQQIYYIIYYVLTLGTVDAINSAPVHRLSWGSLDSYSDTRLTLGIWWTFPYSTFTTVP